MALIFLQVKQEQNAFPGALETGKQKDVPSLGSQSIAPTE